MNVWPLIGGIALILVLLNLDPYSHGYRGGDVLIVVHPWQRIAIACEVALLLVGLGAGVLRLRRTLIVAIAAEATLFVGLSAVWVTRDGATRFLVGYESSFETAYVVAAGLLLRILIIVWAWGSDHRMRGAVSTEAQGSNGA